MMVKKIVVCQAQVPFIEGGAEFHVRELVKQLKLHGYEAELISVPFKWYPKEEIIAHASAWRLLDLSESAGQPIDLAIGLKFPSYFVRHPCKVSWIIHQYRAAYDLCGTPYADFKHIEGDVGLRNTLMQLDRKMLGECRGLFTNAKNTAARLKKFNGITADPLYHPPRLASQLRSGEYGNYVLSVGRLESVKRVELAVKAMQHVDKPIRLLVVGDGTYRQKIQQMAEQSGIEQRIELLGQVSDKDLIDLYSKALAVIYVPYDEDYGYVTLEAFLARRPVITAEDSGGPLEFVKHDVNGAVCQPEAESIASEINSLAGNRTKAAMLGESGYDSARDISWSGVVEQLVGAAENNTYDG
jgi:glycosyltransferase involved in cell wall biosynthesis